MKFDKVTLEGRHVRLEPLSEIHREGLCQAISDGELWNLFVTLVPHLDDIDDFIRHAQIANDSGDGITFATIDRSTS